jgi:queuosine precursor transporter
MNELLFIFQMSVIFLCTLGVLKLGKEALVSWVCLQALLANFFVLKEITLFSLSVTGSDAFAVGGVLGLNFLREYYGKEISKKTIITCFCFLVFFALLSKIHLLYVPGTFDTTHKAYEMLLSPTPRLLLSSLFVFFIVQKIDLHLISRLKKSSFIASFTVRTMISLILCELLDTILFTYLGLYGIISSPIDVIAVSFLVKVAIIFFLSPTTWLAKRYLSLKEASS